jgi:hypothetical protein
VQSVYILNFECICVFVRKVLCVGRMEGGNMLTHETAHHTTELDTLIPQYGCGLDA